MQKYIKLLEYTIGENLGDLRFGNTFLDNNNKKHDPWSEKLISWSLLKLNTYVLQNSILKRIEDKP